MSGQLLQVAILGVILFGSPAHALREKISCIENGKFYRNPNRDPNEVWSDKHCSKYFLCIEGEVYDFKCSTGLSFDINRQICDFKDKVDNCDITSEVTTPKPLFNTEEPICPTGEHACADGTCLPTPLFCDGHADCYDGSDEGWCDAEHDPNAAPSCDYSNCTLPHCFCSVDGTLVPGGMDPSDVPQMVIITFDDAVNDENWDLYQEKLFPPGKKNPNGCPIHGTFFISHEYSNYAMVNKLWNQGHEIAVHSITHRSPENWWDKNATIEDWFDEMVGQANIINRFGGVRMEDIRGVRVPFLRPGWNKQFLMMKEFGFVYDASIPAPLSDPPIWPYTLDFKIPHKCISNRMCPSRSFPGIWEMPLNQLVFEEYSCAMVDSCPPYFDQDEIYEILMTNFNRHYNSNRAPLGLYFHTTWFKDKKNRRAFRKFLDQMVSRNDVWVVNNYEAIQWMQSPTPQAQMNDFQAWKSCDQPIPIEEQACNIPNVCKLFSRELRKQRYLYTCKDCPDTYPWIKNEFGMEFK
ncbi:hypothetical protein TCAL_01640 [Tigriopus californicus]|uniref:Chitin-binding type-2 domain-containing protein n=1 Tax=Tigriopus californicus TaxID=6832 RepID=A0A553PA91_TIGCA|nr:chitin deacetylase 1-like [Tigriopus californicus]TRY74589.1 hypothetical protein TCAL_01640 [Tigriopus californicus]|eukprot:TCALIF_01640-PA protein Name:"Similar to SSPO SCO-spondin (Homo sapiens)" AED:0.01 eAED:0.01 QI:197/1/1/1/1/1/2/74/520